MPTVTIPGSSSHSTKEYAPLADEVNPPFGNVAPSPTVTNGAVVYSKPLRSSGSNTPTDEAFTASSSRVLRTFSDDLTTRIGIKGKGREYPRDSRDYDWDESDISTQNRLKGKERDWEGHGYTQSDSTHDYQQQRSYPPLNEAEEEEKRIQANLAKFTARETARRKAARTSRVMSPTPSQSSASSSTTSLSRTGPRPLSVLTEGISSRRSSLRGYVGSLVGRGDRGSGSVSTLASASGSQDLELSSPTSARTVTNPYEVVLPAKKPGMGSPTSPTMQPSSPFADPPNAITGSSGNRGVPMESPLEDSTGFGYQGSGWRGGGAVAVPRDEEGTLVAQPPKPERWWHALCAWGAELDGGHGKKTSNQAGRTNPFE